jgi:PKD repeat protein
MILKKLHSVLFVALVGSVVFFSGCGKDEENKCANVSCLNGGTCNNGACQCPTGFTGSRCETPATNAAPTASFTASTVSGNAPLTVNLTSTSTGATSLLWSVRATGSTPSFNAPFLSSTDAVTSVTFTKAGTYQIALEARNSVGSNTATKDITVLDNSVNPECQTNNTGTLTIYLSGTSNPYKVFINGSYREDMTAGFKTFTVPAGNASIKLEQRSGYALYPTVRETSANIIRCETYEWRVNL